MMSGKARANNDHKRLNESHSRLKKSSSFKKKNFGKGELEQNHGEGVPAIDKSTTDVVELISSDLYQYNLQGIKALRKMLVRDLTESLIDEIIDLGLIPKIVGFLKSGNEVLQFEAAWAITNIATGDTRQSRYLIEAGAVDALIELLYSRSACIQEQAAWALGNIAGDSYEFKDFVLAKGAAGAVIHLLKNAEKLPVLQTVTWLFSILCKGTKDFRSLTPAIPILRELLKNDDVDLVSQCCWSLASLSEGPERINELLDNNVPPYLVPLLSRENDIIEPALQVIGNIVTGDELPTQVMIDCGLLPTLVRLLESSSYSIRKEVCWIISNIMAGTKKQIQAVMDVNPFPSMLYLLAKDGMRTKKEIVWAIRNVTTGGTVEHVKFMIGQGVIDKLCGALTAGNTEVVQVSLRALEAILNLGESESKPKGSANQIALAIEECRGIEALETLLSHESPEIYRKAYDLMEKFFNTVD